MSRRSAVLVPLSAALVAGALVGVPAQGASSPGTDTQLRGEAAAALPRADGPPTLTFRVVLPYDRAALRSAAQAVSTPGSPRFRTYLTLQQAARAYGATPKARARLQEWARERRMQVSFDATGLTAEVTGPTRAWEEEFGTSYEITAADPAPRALSIYMPSADDTELVTTTLPKSLAGVAQFVFAVDNVLGPDQPVPPEPTPQVPAPPPPPTNLGSPFGPGADCLGPYIGGLDPRPLTYSPRQIHTPYGTAALHARGLKGKGSRLAILALGQAFSPDAAAYAADCFGFRLPPVRVRGGAGMPDRIVPTSGFDGIESNLDLQTAAAVLPDAASIGFVETMYGASAIEPYLDAVTTALAELDPDVMTLSYAECTFLLKATRQWSSRIYAEDVFTMAGLVGTSLLFAAGDSGSSGCLHFGIPVPELDVSWPASSPWVTAVGGTRLVLGEGNVRVREVPWNDTTWNPDSPGGGGGGPSSGPRPWYQESVTSRDRRMVPDVAAHASEYPGWPVAMTREQYRLYVGIDLPPGAEVSMAPVGGTSASTPFTAANVALIAARHGRLGLLNPWLYSMAEGAAYDSAFYDIRTGTNQVDPVPGCCAATSGYDMATGLGSPVFPEWLARAGRG